MGDGNHLVTVILLFIPGHFLNCVYTRSLSLTLFIKGGGINHTSVLGAASAWAAGTLL